MNWRVFNRAVTGSTNDDARAGVPGDVFTADFQFAGRGRLNHVWLSRPRSNLLMSAVLGVDDLPAERVATLPLVVGLSVCEALQSAFPTDVPDRYRLKWPNDVLIGGRKICGILCVRGDAGVIAGIGVNVAQREFPPEIADRAVSLAQVCASARKGDVRDRVRDEVLARLAENLALWREAGFAALLPRMEKADALKGATVTVKRTDDDLSPASGTCGGIADDGALIVAGERVYAGEAHVVAASALGPETVR